MALGAGIAGIEGRCIGVCISGSRRGILRSAFGAVIGHAWEATFASLLVHKLGKLAQYLATIYLT